jgi:hypothetical protein
MSEGYYAPETDHLCAGRDEDAEHRSQRSPDLLLRAFELQR